ncbi:hypothetical protein GCM10009678_40130 [Actinomadura kijaniata]|uniref:Bacillolysin n=1 Tax=Actinomadura namibiensis TaxID=182080 RepID=A0A7W3LUD8_ACTNM|nr:M4 family metallopeptidase [Actinomadura namibiensis]MBA8954469.1 bacillolysin [Actinomadura namibiensis]
MSPRYPLLIGGAAMTALLGSTLAPVAATADPAPVIEKRSGTASPALVSGLNERAASGDPVAAARTHLADPRYKIKNPGAELAPLGVVRDGADETVRLQQRHHGVPVLGGHYLVRFRTERGARRVVGAGGRFQTALTVPTTPAVPERIARGVALGQTGDLATRLGERAATAEPRGLVVLPRGGGQLAWHFVVRGEEHGAPTLREVYVDARTGALALAYDRLRHAAEGPVAATGKLAKSGRQVTVNAFRRADGKIELRDRGRGAEIVTFDAQKRDVARYEGGPVPADTPVVASGSTVFGPEATETGAVDAHWAAGQVYDFYKALGRNGLDDRNGPIHSVVNVTSGGQMYFNAFWDGTKMVYGGGGPDHHSLAAALDVDGHEMTHGVIEHSANLVYFGQAGAINEGLADYFGNAIETRVHGRPMTASGAGLIGEDMCRTAEAAKCAIRDLNDGRRADRDYIGVTGQLDNAGVHLNSTIFSGALWDVRERIGGAKADKLVYKALTEYMTPLDDFTDARRAVEAAARAMKLTGGERRAVRAAFDAHGVTPGWEKRIGVDSRLLLPNVTAPNARPAAAGDRYAIAQSDATRTEPSAVYTGTARGKRPTRFSPRTGGIVQGLDTDGRTVAWGELNATTGVSRVLVRPFDRSAPPKEVFSGEGWVNDVAVDGRNVAFTFVNHAATDANVWLSRNGGRAAELTPGPEMSLQTSAKGGRIAYQKPTSGGVAVHDAATGKETVVRVKGTVQWPTLTRTSLLFALNTDADRRSAIKKVNLDGTGLTDLRPEGDRLSWLSGLDVDAADRWVTIGAYPAAATYANENLPKLFQFPLAGGEPRRYSCNRGQQGAFAATAGRGAVWLDGTRARPDLVTRTGPTRALCR